MRLIFVYWQLDDAGSAQTIHNFSRAARELGHEIVLYGRANGSPFNYSTEVSRSDGLVFIFEGRTALQYGDNLDLARLIAQVPRERRVVIDCDGGYNDVINFGGDLNHDKAAASARWIEICDSLSDKIVQPTMHPLRENVRTFLFHGYNPKWDVPLDFSNKGYGMCYVGNNWHRWRALHRVLKALEPVRTDVGRIVLVGDGWGSPPRWASWASADAYFTDPDYLRGLGIELRPPVPVEEVVSTMSLGVVNPVLLRPIFNHLRLVTCRTFETPAANTIPLFNLDAEYVAEIFGPDAIELVLGEDGSEQIVDILRRPDHYAEIVREIRRRLAERHSFTARVRELVDICEEAPVRPDAKAAR